MHRAAVLSSFTERLWDVGEGCKAVDTRNHISVSLQMDWCMSTMRSAGLD